MSASDHFHTPPDPEDPPVVDANVSRRLESNPVARPRNDYDAIDQLWTDVTDPVYPNAYEFRREFGEAYLD